MDSKKLLKELKYPERTETERLTLHIDKGVLARLHKRFPRNTRPSVSEVVERIVVEFLDGLDKAKR
jgi:hypothetical protein